MNYVLDACAMIALLCDEPGAEVVWDCLTESGSQCFAHSINLFEVYYDMHRRTGEATAKETINDLLTMGIIERTDLERALWEEAGNLKANATKKNSIAPPDCFGLALTRKLNGQLLTSDHGEFDILAANGIYNIRFIR